jgi:hypothetical protein
MRGIVPTRWIVRSVRPVTESQPNQPYQPGQPDQPGQPGQQWQAAQPAPAWVPPPASEQWAPPGPPAQPPAKRGKRKILIGVVVVIAVCAGLCGIGQLITNVVNQDDWKDLGEPVTRPAARPTPTPTWARPNPLAADAKADPQIRHQLEAWVLISAGVQKPVTSTCDTKGFTGDSAATFDCTVTFEGQKVVYTISTTPKGSGVFSWTAKTTANVVTREGILQVFAEQYTEANGWSGLRCDPLPEVVLAPVNQALPQVCYAKLKDKKTAKVVIKPTPQNKPYLESVFQE